MKDNLSRPGGLIIFRIYVFRIDFQKSAFIPFSLPGSCSCHYFIALVRIPITPRMNVADVSTLTTGLTVVLRRVVVVRV
jgi:hypothetical protein